MKKLFLAAILLSLLSPIAMAGTDTVKSVWVKSDRTIIRLTNDEADLRARGSPDWLGQCCWSNLSGDGFGFLAGSLSERYIATAYATRVEVSKKNETRVVLVVSDSK